jgi:hypothetical protein
MYAFLGYIRNAVISKSVAFSNEFSVQKLKKRRRKDTYALTGFSCAIFHMKKKPRDSITVKTESA